MKEDVHQQAEHLLLKAAVEQLTPSEASWLGLHLEDCSRCSQVAGRLEEVVRSLRSVSVAADPSLVEIARRRVRRRAGELAPGKRSSGLVWVACVLTWGWVMLSAPYIWRGFAWLGEYVGIPDWAWKMGFGLWWLLPAVAAGAALAMFASAGAMRGGEYGESY